MSYHAGAALQGAIYQALRADPGLAGHVGDAIFDAMPADPPSGVHVALGPEEVRDASDATAGGALHEFTVSVLAGSEASTGFGAVKAAAAAAAAALEGHPPELETGRVAGLWFMRARARRIENGGARRVDLTFRARVDLG